MPFPDEIVKVFRGGAQPFTRRHISISSKPESEREILAKVC